MIKYGQQSIDQSDIESVVDILKSDWLTQGPTVPKFEESVASKVGAKFGVASNSATSALHIAYMSLDLSQVILFGQVQIHLLRQRMLQFFVVQKLIL